MTLAEHTGRNAWPPGADSAKPVRHTADARFTTIIHDRSALPLLLSEWSRLAERCVEDNVYYSPRYALALLESVSLSANVKFVTALDGDLLVALLPVVVSPLPIPGLRPAGRAWQTPFTFGCMPLLDRSCPDEAAAALLEGLARLKGGDWVIPQINADGPTSRALIGALESRRTPWVSRNAFERASIKAGPTFEQHMQDHVGAKRRRDLARNRRRLEELGTVAHQSFTSGAELDGAVEAFLKIEASGWKGQRGTALDCAKETRAFARKAFGSNGAESICRADLLLLDGKPIAAGMMVFSGQTGFTVKGAYDESYAAFGAGLLLEVEVVKSFLTDRKICRQ